MGVRSNLVIGGWAIGLGWVLCWHDSIAQAPPDIEPKAAVSADAGDQTAAASGDSSPEDSPAITAEQLEFFEKQVRPLLVDRCYGCHSNAADTIEGELRLDDRAAVLRGGASGAAAIPGQADASLLIRAVRYTDPLLQMPPDAKLSDREVNVLTLWVADGLPDPRRVDDTDVASNEHVGLPDLASNQEPLHSDWWSFQPVTLPPIPTVRNPQWCLHPIDHFVRQKLESLEMTPAGPADKRTLIRRATYDLTGLPPTAADVAAFFADESPEAFANVVDRLLNSRQYAEQWGRHWLDVVRYADTSGCNGDFPVPDAYRYRNYVIDCFQNDVPYDQFVHEQIAGDLLAESTTDEQQRARQIIATGYLAISRRYSSLNEEFHLTLEDTIDNLGKAYLGLTIGCARCHDHKFDPIPQEDFYRLYGIFDSSTFAFPGTEIYRHAQDLVPLVFDADQRAQLRPQWERMQQLDREIFVTYSAMAEKDTGDEKRQLRSKWEGLAQERDALLKALPKYDRAYAASEGQAKNARIQLKGDPKNLGREVPRGFLHILGGALVPDGDGSGRRQLAEWLTDVNNPLTARVLVNRVWQNHFGYGLVRSPDDFGTRGEVPTHSELLDYLAAEFVAQGWSIKQLHRWMMSSQTYQMAYAEDAENARRDPENRWRWRFDRRRLSAEELRDSLLFLAGTLDETPGGPHPFPPEWEWRYSQHNPFVDDFATSQRTVYLMQQRIRQQPYLAVFDGADTNVTTGLRRVSATPQQALFAMNNPFAQQQAEAFFQRIRRDNEGPPEPAWVAAMLQVTEADEQEVGELFRGYQRLLSRAPTTEEVAEAGEYVARVMSLMEQATEGHRLSPTVAREQAWVSYYRVLLSGNEFMFVE